MENFEKLSQMTLSDVLEHIKTHPKTNRGPQGVKMSGPDVWEPTTVVMAYMAAKYGRLDVLSHLLTHQLVPIQIDDNLLLKNAVHYRHRALVEYLLTSQELTEHSMVEGKSCPTRTSYYTSHSSAVEELCRTGDLELLQYVCSLQEFDKTPGLAVAAIHGHQHIIEYLIDNYPISSFKAALSMAVTGNKLDIASYLIAQGAEVTRSQLYGTLMQSRKEMFALLVSHVKNFEVGEKSLNFVIKRMTSEFFQYIVFDYDFERYFQHLELDAEKKAIILQKKEWLQLNSEVAKAPVSTVKKL